MDKEKIEQLILKIKRAKRLMKSVDAKIGTCGLNDDWHIYNPSDFRKVCQALEVGYGERFIGNETIEISTKYNGVNIFSLERTKKGGENETV